MADQEPPDFLQANYRHHPMLFSEWLIVSALLFTFLIANGELLGLKLQQSFLKHLVGMVMVGASLFDYFGRRLFSAHITKRTGNSLIFWAPLLTLGVLVTVGSLYARLSLNIEDTFFIIGLYIFVGWTFSLALQSGNFDRLLSIVFWITLAASFATSVVTIWSRLTDFHVLDTAIHEREFFVIPLLYVLFFTDRGTRFFRWTCIVLIFSAAVASLKNTPTLILFITLSLSLWRWQVGSSDKNSGAVRKIALIYFVVLAAVAAFIGAIMYANYVKEITPIGNVNFRQHQYTFAWNEFLKSPLIGSGFTTGTGIDYNLRQDIVMLSNLPTHNDILDILRAGGLVGFTLWFLPLFIVFGRAALMLRQKALTHQWSEHYDNIGWMLLSSISAVIVYCFNPLLAKTAFATIVWVFWAFLASMVTSRPMEKNDR